MLRGILVALPRRYAALMQRVETLTNMQDCARATKLFKREIPGALPLQWHFYQTISSPQWLPHLLQQDLVNEPLAADDTTAPKQFGEWPIGHYLLNVAKSGDASAFPLIIIAIQKVADRSTRK